MDDVDEILTEQGAEEAGAQIGRAAGETIGAKLARMVDENARQADEPEPEPTLPGPPPDPATAQCPSCHGHGQTYTGSLVEMHLFRECPTCKGRGYIDLDEPREAVPTVGEQRTVTFTEVGGWTWEK